MLAAVLVSAARAADAAELTFDIVVAHGRVADNMQLIRVTEGDRVRLRWSTDQPLVVHLHGYDIEQRLPPGAPTEFVFIATATGRFPVHAHAPEHGGAGAGHDDAPLVVIEVYPR